MHLCWATRQRCSGKLAVSLQLLPLKRLVYFDEAGNVLPGLATGWNIDSAANTITLTFTDGVKFHDGTDFNAEAVKWNFEKYLDQKRSELLAIESIDVPK
jgi:peptide/nickel transport system substrate-binding protein